VHVLVSQALDYAVETGALQVNPCTQLPKADRPAHPQRQVAVKCWTAKQAGTFLAATADDRWHPLWAFLLDSGAGAAKPSRCAGPTSTSEP
jgi:hypothetical protein